MPMDSLGGRMPAGRPAAVFAGGKTHVFAIAAGGAMNHWSSADGVDWTGPSRLPAPRGISLTASYPCAIAVGNAIHVFGINNGDGLLVHWVSLDGNTFLAPATAAATVPIPGGNSGVAAARPTANEIDVFAVRTDGIVRYSWAANSSALLRSVTLPGSTGLPRSVPAAASSGSNTVDVFAIHADGSALRWNSTSGAAWTPSVLPRPTAPPGGPLVRTGFAAVSAAAGQVEVFAVIGDGSLANWSIKDASAPKVARLDSPPGPIPEGLPAAIVADDGHLEVFAIGQPPNPFIGGPLLRWRRDRGTWTGPDVIGANLAAGGLGASAAPDRVDAFGFNSGTDNSLLRWPGGVSSASAAPWANWANSQAVNPTRHCYPSTVEEVVAIVKTAEKMPGARVRAVGSSWSFPDIAMTPGIIVETSQLNDVITHVIDRSVLTDTAPDPRYLVHVEAGIQVEALMGVLDRKGLAPFTMGGSSGQTLAGVISTSVHGSDVDRGPIPNAVRALEIVGPGGVRHWIEPDQWRITREGPLAARLGPAVRIRYDDDWFDAVLVSVGSMGIITSVVLEVTDQYLLEKSCEEMRWSQLKPRLDPLASDTVFNGTDRYVMIAVDPVEKGDRTCYVTTRRVFTGPAPTPTPGGSSDPLGMYCNLDIDVVLAYLTSLGILDAILLAFTTTLNSFGIPVPPVPAAAAGVIIAGVLKASGPGAVGDFIARLLDNSPQAAAALATYLTRDALKPGVKSADLAHRIMAPPNPGECAARGLALEVAFDTEKDNYLGFVEAAMVMLDQRRDQGKVLGGWFSMRFVGPSRAILSPQQAARTCMIEFVGLRALSSTAPLLDELEQLAKVYGGIQHWGMFSIPNLSKADVVGAYPRLDTFRRVRRAMSNGGAIQTFENAFSTRVGLDDAPAGVPLTWQDRWRWCSKCMLMAFGGGAAGPCPAGGTHDHAGSGNYGFAHNMPATPGQRFWLWCNKCMGMTFAGGPAGACAAGGSHDNTGSGEYTIVRNGQPGWKRCRKCQSLSQSGGACPTGGPHELVDEYWLAFSSTEPAGDQGWRWCDRCGSLSKAGGVCDGGVPHSHGGSRAYRVPINAPTAPGQAHWRHCRKCETLTYGPGACFATAASSSGLLPIASRSALRRRTATLAATHDLVGSGDYTIRTNAGQGEWRRCMNCQGLFFNGGGATGVCTVQPATIAPIAVGPAVMTGPGRGPTTAAGFGAAPAGHQASPDEFFVPYT